MRAEPRPDLGDLMIVMLAGTLAGVRDRLRSDGFVAASDLVAILVDISDDYLTGSWEPPGPGEGGT
jgi:hypothetical protein